jgi:sister-chromatid-cohesion protein PDS5
LKLLLIATYIAVTQKSYIEMSLVQLVHLLANHPDFGEDDDEIRLFIPFIDLFLSCVATSENVSFLYHIAQKIKATTDVTNPETSKVKLYHIITGKPRIPIN